MRLTGANFCDMKLTGGNACKVALPEQVQQPVNSYSLPAWACSSSGYLHSGLHIASMHARVSLRCSRLQAAAVAHGESLPIPEIVAIGGQSDGKSSLLEAFLGFRFNIR